MTPVLGSLPDGSRGFDCNTTVTPMVAGNFAAAGYRFAVRYVRRVRRHAFDLTSGEILTILEAGLGLMVVQHVANEGWVPTPERGSNYGAVAAAEARSIGVPQGISLWCDLEGVQLETPADDVISYCNNWHREVLEAGYRPGLYVGWHPGLDAVQLYRKLRFDAYWSAYNLGRDNYPIRRGVQMRQFPYPPAGSRVPGVSFQYDVNVIHADALGGTPTLFLPTRTETSI